MESIGQLINEWEIQILVLISFILQVFLFFTGSLRRSSTNVLLRGTIWAAYLGADMVAIYALGYLSRHEHATTGNCDTLKRTEQLTYFWAPFLLIHLGGQDTITAFSMEDNSLWLRHLLNLIVQVALALYVFWKSATWQNTYLLVPGILLFVVGIIKYGERTVALFQGNLNNIKESTFNEEEDTSDKGEKILLQYVGKINSHYGLVSTSLIMKRSIRELFARRSIFNDDNDLVGLVNTAGSQKRSSTKLVDIELGMIMYNDLYTKAPLLRTRSGIILRCTSQLCTIIALVVFVVGNKQAEYGRADVVITYILFIGGFLLEVCALLIMFIASPWTWAWLKGQQYGSRLAALSWSLLSSDLIGWLGEKPLWSKTMGQYSFIRYMGYDKPAVSFSQRVMSLVRMAATAIGIRDVEKKLFWVSKLLDTKYEVVDDRIMECFVEEISHLGKSDEQQPWTHIGKLMEVVGLPDFVDILCTLHLITEVYLSEEFPTTTSIDEALADICRKLSNYMFYLVVAHPFARSILQMPTNDPEAMMVLLRRRCVPPTRRHCTKETVMRVLKLIFKKEIKSMSSSTQGRSQVLEELKIMWVRIIIYAAGKSRPEVHAAQLSKGGELLTHIWLLMAHQGLGDCMEERIQLIPDSDRTRLYARYLFKLPSKVKLQYL